MKQILAIFAACLLSTALFPSASFSAVNQNEVLFSKAKNARVVGLSRLLILRETSNLVSSVADTRSLHNQGKLTKSDLLRPLGSLKRMLFQSQKMRKHLKCRKKKPACTRKRRQVFDSMKQFISDVKTARKDWKWIIKNFKKKSKILTSISTLDKRAKKLRSSFLIIASHLKKAKK